MWGRLRLQEAWQRVASLAEASGCNCASCHCRTTLLWEPPGNRVRPSCRWGVCLPRAAQLTLAEGGSPRSLAVRL